MKTKVVLKVIREDIGRARCGNRRQCVLAQAIDRQLGLAGKGYVRVDANGASYTRGGRRFTYHLPSSALRYLRRFDEIGERLGEMEARRALDPHSFLMKLIETKPVSAPATRKRKDRINFLRNKRTTEARAKGKLPTTYKRYTGISPKALEA